jgi:hypothetical protein
MMASGRVDGARRMAAQLDPRVIKRVALIQSLADEQGEHDAVAVAFQPKDRAAVIAAATQAGLADGVRGAGRRRVELVCDLFEPPIACMRGDAGSADCEAGQSFVAQSQHAPTLPRAR